MPFFTPGPEDGGLRQPMGQPPAPPVDPRDVADAAFRQDNSLVSTISAMRNSQTFTPDPDHNPLDLIKDTPYEQKYIDRFVGSHSEAETRLIMGQIDSEERDRRILAGSGTAGFIASTIAGWTDPIWLLMGVAAPEARAAGALRTMGRTGLEVGLGGALQEGILQSTQQSRPLADSAMNVGSMTLLSALLGGGARLFNRDQTLAMTGALNHDRVAAELHAKGDPIPEGFDAHTTQEPTQFGFEAHHGSPHDFDAFDISKVGAGEGNQAYGHGLYFAEHEGVARSYQEALGGDPANRSVDHFEPYEKDKPDGLIAARSSKGNLLGTIGREGDGAGYRVLADGPDRLKLHEVVPTLDEAKALIEKFALNNKAGGSLYRVRILADREHFLDWDKPLGEQSTKVQEAMGPILREFGLEQEDPKHLAGTHILNRMSEKLANGASSSPLVTERLREAGIPGIKYLDAGSRAGSEGTSNYVVFDDKLVAVTHKNGKPILGREAATDSGKAAGEPGAAPLPQPGESAAAPQAAAAGAAATDTRALKPVSALGLEKLAVDFGQRALLRPFPTARRAMVDLVELPTEVEGNLRGETTTLGGGPALETEARVTANKTKGAINRELTRLWTDLRFNGQKAPWFAKLRDQLGIGERPPELPTFEQFKELVSDAMMFGDKHDIPQVQAAAQFVRAPTFDHWGPRAEAAIPGFKPAEQIEGEGYFPHSWDKQKIKAQRPGFVNHLTELYAADQTAKAAAKDRLTGLSEQLEAARAQVAKAKDEASAAAASLRHDQIREKIEKEIGAWQGGSSAEAKSAIKAREKYRADQTEAGKTPGAESRLTSADAAVDRAVKSIIESHRDLTVEELRNKAHETTDRILGSPDGRLPYDEFAGSPDFGPRPPGAPARGSLAERQLNVSNSFARDWIERDIEKVTETYLRTFMPDVMLAERFGDVEMSEAFRKINDEHAALSDQAKGEKAVKDLDAHKEGAIEDLAAARDLFRGVYNIPQTAMAKRMGRISRAVRNLNVPLSMGVSALSSLPDAGGSMLRWGMMNSFRDAWVPFVKSLMTNRELPREAMRQFKVMGIAVDTETAGRHHQISGITAPYELGSPLERTLQWGADKFQLANMLGPWTDIVKSISSTVAATGFLRAAEAATKGTATQHQLRSLGAANITTNMAERIAKQYRESGTMVDDVLLPNTEHWTDKEAQRVFEGALSRDANIMVVTPGLAKPLFMHDPIAAMLFQFKSYTAAAHTRILIANLQRRDANTLSGVVGMLGIGMLSYKLNAMTGGSPTSDNPADWIKEAASRGNIFGWFEEANTMASKLSGGTIDAYRATGSNHPLSRYAGRSILDQVMGPTAGKIQRIGQVTSAAGRADWNAGDTHALRQLTAMQNLWYLRGLFDQVEAGANSAFGIPAKSQTQH